MYKPFRTVKEFVKSECKVMLAGIAFTLFSANVVEADACQPVFEQVEPIERLTEKVKPAQDEEIEVMLSSTSLTTKEKLDDAFEKFSKECNENTSVLQEPFQEISSAVSGIKADKVAVDGDPSEGRLNVAFRLRDGMILSLNKKIGLHDRGIVGFNLLKNRRLVISDVVEIALLSKYIENVQNRLS